MFTLKSTLSPAQISVAEAVISGFIALMVIYSLQLTPLVVTSTQYSVVSVGVTVIFSVVSPVDQVYEEELAGVEFSNNLNLMVPQLSDRPPRS